MKGKVILITGATSGIGRETAVEFGLRGASVFVVGRRETEGLETVTAVEKTGAKASFFKADVSIEEDCANMVQACLSKFGRLDFAFNNAGIEGILTPIVEQTPENFRQVIDINVLGVLLSMKYEIPALRATGGGAIVNTASIAGHIGMPGMASYAASKHAVIGITKVAALETARENIRINSISPAAIETDMYARFTNNDKATQEYLGNLHPVGRTGKSSEISGAVVFLCSPEASFITGTDLRLDGGFTAQ